MSPRAISINNRHPRLHLNRRVLACVIHLLDLHSARFLSGCPSGELSIAFLSDSALAKLHQDFLGDPTPTDVITFPSQPSYGTAGEICISADAALRQVGQNDKKLNAELMLYLVHGWLHLAGYDDLVPAKKRAMRRAETRALRLLHTAALPPAFVIKTPTAGRQSAPSVRR
jgi:probable rRNA maturation factor